MTKPTQLDVREHREPDYAIESIFYERWSPRAMAGAPVDDDQLFRLFEAARWAPSSFNRQPWRFLYAKRDGPHWTTFLNLLSESNRRWADQAAVLVVIASLQQTEDGKPIRTHSYDTGAAWQNLALQGTSMGLVVHGMAGFDYGKARSVLNVPDDFAIEAMAAIGLPGRISDLPEKYREREEPGGRRPVKEFARAGGFA